jgi:hypothetical protein
MSEAQRVTLEICAVMEQAEEASAMDAIRDIDMPSLDLPEINFSF